METDLYKLMVTVLLIASLAVIAYLINRVKSVEKELDSRRLVNNLRDRLIGLSEQYYGLTEQNQREKDVLRANHFRSLEIYRTRIKELESELSDEIVKNLKH